MYFASGASDVLDALGVLFRLALDGLVGVADGPASLMLIIFF